MAFPLSSATNESVTVGTSTTAILAANGQRHYAAIINSGSYPVYLGIGAEAVANKGIYLAPSGGSYEINEQNLFIGAINGIAVGGDSNVTVVHSSY